jgi:hypothetical protein
MHADVFSLRTTWNFVVLFQCGLLNMCADHAVYNPGLNVAMLVV